jgi:Na+-translocating ferredoxin:NAD+ oxidoreductase RnfE subunit
MQEDPQVAEHRRRMNLDPRNLDPRKALDSASLERVLRAQALARAQAQAATTVVIGTIVTLISSAFGFVAALAWNDAIRDILSNLLAKTGLNTKFGATGEAVLTAVVFTIIAVIAIVILQRVAGRWAKKAAISAAASDGSY